MIIMRTILLDQTGNFAIYFQNLMYFIIFPAFANKACFELTVTSKPNENFLYKSVLYITQPLPQVPPPLRSKPDFCTLCQSHDFPFNNTHSIHFITAKPIVEEGAEQWVYKSQFTRMPTQTTFSYRKCSAHPHFFCRTFFYNRPT